MNDQTNIAANSNRPEIFVFYLVELVETKSWTCRVQLQVERCGFDQLLFLAGESGEAISKSVGDEEFHISKAFMPE